MVALRKAEPVNELEDLLRRFLLHQHKSGRYDMTARPVVMAMLEAMESLTELKDSQGMQTLVAVREASETLSDALFELTELVQRAKEMDE